MPINLPAELRKIPWATYGRYESIQEIEKICQNQKDKVSLLKYAPKISFICLYRRNKNWERTLESLIHQSYANWELIIISDGAVSQAIEDPRIKVFERSFATTADAKNIGLKAVEGEWVGFLEAGDVLSPVALFNFVFKMNSHPNSILFYCNEAKFDHASNQVSEFWSKGNPSWFNLIHFNSVGSLFLIKTAYLQNSECFKPKHSPDENLSLLLSLYLENPDWIFIPEYLYYRHEDAVSSILRRREIVEEHLSKKGFSAYVGSNMGSLEICPLIEKPKENLVSVIIPFKDKATMTIRCLEYLSKQKGEVPVEVILINNNSSSESIHTIDREIHRFSFPVKIVSYEKPFNFGAMNNLAIKNHSKGNLLLLLNNDVFLEGERSLDQMAAWALKEFTGTVGIRLYYEHGSIQHSGFDVHYGGFSRMARVGNGQGKDRFANENHEVFGSTFACSMIKKKTYESIGGFREIDLANGFGDIAFNFECLRKGLHNLYLGRIYGMHLESVSRGETYEYWEECTLEREYSDILQKMLREDLGIDKLPADDSEVFNQIKELTLGRLRKHAPWLKSVKRSVMGLKQKNVPIGWLRSDPKSIET